MTTRTRPRGRAFVLALAALTTTAVLAACSSSGDSGASDAATAEKSDSLSSAGQDDAVRDGDGQSADPGSPGADAPSGSAARPPAMQRSVISKAAVSLTSDDVARTRHDVQRVVDAADGSVSEENTETDEDGVAVYSRLVLRVPVGSFATTMSALEQIAELRSSTRSSDDVTTKVIDTDVRVRAQEASLRRVEQLLARARGLKDIIWIESQLTNRQAELDSLKSQQLWLADQTRDATITVDISRAQPRTPARTHEPDQGFLVGLKGGMKALGGFATALATITGALLPFAIVLAVIGVPVWVVVRRSARRRAPREPAPSA